MKMCCCYTVKYAHWLVWLFLGVTFKSQLLLLTVSCAIVCILYSTAVYLGMLDVCCGCKRAVPKVRALLLDCRYLFILGMLMSQYTITGYDA